MSRVILEDVVDKIIDYRGKTPKKLGTDWQLSGIPAISAKNIKNGSIVRQDTIRFVDKETYGKWMKEKVTIGDVLMTSEAPLGETYFVKSDTPFVLSQRLFAIRTKTDKLDPRYFYILTKTPMFQKILQTFGTGATVSGIRQALLWKLPLDITDIDSQKKIVDMAWDYDALIENNTKRIEKLEAMAHLLYRHYFEIPESTDWEVVKIGEILGKVPTSAKLQKSEYLNEGTYPVIDQGKEYIAGYTNRQEAVITDNLPLTVFGDHTRAVKLAQNPFARGADGTQIVVSDILPPYYLYQTIKNLPLSNEHYARHFKLLKVTEIAKPPASILVEFEAKVEPIFRLIDTLTRRNRNLAKARDLLLPRLMSGEITV